jgi:parallel beta-helix repeat protein
VITGLDEDPSDGICSDDADNHGITITENTVSHCRNGIRTNFDNGTITNNTISYCTRCLSDTGSGNTVTGNILTNCPNG